MACSGERIIYIPVFLLHGPEIIEDIILRLNLHLCGLVVNNENPS
jgi:hypothetical protein